MIQAAADQVFVQPDGTVRAGSRAAERLARRGGTYRLLPGPPELVLLRREGLGTGRLLLAGEIVSDSSVAEILGFVATARWSGELHLQGEGFRRILGVHQGALRHARSEDLSDRFDQVLIRLGALTAGALAPLSPEVEDGRRLGQALLERGLVDRETLFRFLRAQAEQIFFRALEAEGGTFAFFAAERGAAPPPITLHIPIQSLLIEGMTRIDERAAFRRRIPDNAVRPRAREGAVPRAKGGELEARLLPLCDGTRDVEALIRATGCDEFSVLQALYELLEARCVDLEAGEEVPEAEVRQLVGRFNEILRDLFDVATTFGDRDQMSQVLGAWVQGSGFESYFGPGLAAEGEVDPVRVLQSLSQLPTKHLETLHQAIHEVASFALFAATCALPKEIERTLAQEINRRLAEITV